MRNSFLVLLIILIGHGLSAQEKLHLYFIGIDSVNKSERGYLSRVVIRSKATYHYPTKIEIFTDSAISNFGFLEIQVFDTVYNVFKPYRLKVYIDKIYQETDYSLKTANQQNLRIRLGAMDAFQPGLYRARITIWFSKFNRGWQDKISDWSYFYKQEKP